MIHLCNEKDWGGREEKSRWEKKQRRKKNKNKKSNKEQKEATNLKSEE